MRLSGEVTWIRRDHEWTVCYRLTSAGGGEWERAARADWSRYVEYSAWPEGDGWERSIVCADAARAEQYLAFQRSVWHKPGAVSEESIVRDVLRPWKATYWKELREGHRIRLGTGPCPGLPTRPEEIMRQPRWDRRWHEDPWEGR